MDNFLWTEKYRPNRISDTILPQNLSTTFNEFVEKGIPNLYYVVVLVLERQQLLELC